MLLDLRTWKARGDPFGRRPEALKGCRDHLDPQDSRGTLERLGHLEPREKLELTEPPASQAFLGERVLLGPRDPKEKRGVKEKKETQGRTEWGSPACPGPLDPRGLWSTCRSKMEQW